jgi:hypothetical protein
VDVALEIRQIRFGFGKDVGQALAVDHDLRRILQRIMARRWRPLERERCRLVIRRRRPRFTASIGEEKQRQQAYVSQT